MESGNLGIVGLAREAVSVKLMSKLSLTRLFRSTAWTCCAGNFSAGCIGYPRLMIRKLSQWTKLLLCVVIVIWV